MDTRPAILTFPFIFLVENLNEPEVLEVLVDGEPTREVEYTPSFSMVYDQSSAETSDRCTRFGPPALRVRNHRSAKHAIVH